MAGMKQRPILFQGAMVRALLDGSKTQTRRVVKPQPEFVVNNLPCRQTPDDEKFGRLGVVTPCPYGQTGDQIMVRETFYAWGRWETRFSAKKGRDEWHFVDMTLECGKAYLYDADHPRPQPLAGKRDGGVTPKWVKRPAIFMPRAASRITLEIVSVRVERLQDITEADAIAEGCEPNYLPNRAYDDEPYKSGYVSLWQGINGHGSWAANPWVWVVEFRRLP